MKRGKVFKPGDVVIVAMHFTDIQGIKQRPAVVLFEKYGNVVVAGVTSNLKMDGIPLSREEGAIKDSVIKLNYIFTITEEIASRVLFRLSLEKRQMVFNELNKILNGLMS